MTTWRDVSPGQRVELRGRTFEVVKVKPSGKVAKVTVTGAGGTFKAEVRLKDSVTIVKPSKSKPAKREHWAPDRSTGLVGGQSRESKPVKTGGREWDKPRGTAERALGAALGATLLAETPDEAAGYFVPPVDVSTVAAHLLTFHAIDPSQFATEGDALRVHEQAHKGSAPFAVGHWHTATRPKLAA